MINDELVNAFIDFADNLVVVIFFILLALVIISIVYAIVVKTFRRYTKVFQALLFTVIGISIATIAIYVYVMSFFQHACEV